MKPFYNISASFSFFIICFICLFIPIKASSQELNVSTGDNKEPDVKSQTDIYWHIKAFRPDSKLLDIKAIDKDGNYHDVKAIQNSEDTGILNVKAFVYGKILPIKLIGKGEGDKFYPVKSIDEDGTIIKIKAIAENGEILDVKGFSKTGNVVNLRAITQDYKYYTVVAISPDGMVNTVKGIKMMDEEVEAIIHGVPIFAHVKAIKQE